MIYLLLPVLVVCAVAGYAVGYRLSLYCKGIIEARSDRIELATAKDWDPYGQLSEACPPPFSFEIPAGRWGPDGLIFETRFPMGSIFLSDEAFNNGPPSSLTIKAAARLYGLDPEGTGLLSGDFLGQVVIIHPEHAHDLVKRAQRLGDL